MAILKKLASSELTPTERTLFLNQGVELQNIKLSDGNIDLNVIRISYQTTKLSNCHDNQNIKASDTFFDPEPFNSWDLIVNSTPSFCYTFPCKLCWVKITIST